MSKRNLTLLIVLLIIVGLVLYAYFYFSKPLITPTNTTNTKEDTNFFSNFFSSSSQKTTGGAKEEPKNEEESNIPVTPAVETQTLHLKKVSSFPVAGFGLFDKERFVDVPKVIPAEELEANTAEKNTQGSKPTPPATESVVAVRYVERETGNVYQTFADKIKEQKFSTTVIPVIHEAIFGNNGESVIMRYLKNDNKTITTFAGLLDKEVLGADSASSLEVKGTFLPENITDLSVSSDGTKMFYLFNLKDSSVGIVSSLQGAKKTQVFDSPLTEWLSSFPNNNMVTLTTKPSSTVKGYMYAINIGKGDLDKILGGVLGLTTLTSPNGKLVLYGNNNLSLSLYNIASGETTPLGLRTLPEKCSWTEESNAIYCATPSFVPSGSFPDDWYKGKISFFDDIWKIDVESKVARIFFNSVEEGAPEGIDAINLSVRDNYLFFINKKDSFLWQLFLK